MNLEQLNKLAEIVKSLPTHAYAVDYDNMIAASTSLGLDPLEVHEAWVRLRREVVEHSKEQE
jgi:hypothetical protein